MSKLEVFSEVADAVELHVRGLKEAKAGQFAAAHNLFAEAIEVLEVNTDPHEPSREMQVSRITADDGFTHVREAVSGAVDPKTEIDQAKIKLADARAVTGELLKIHASKFSREARRFLWSEHGKSLALAARIMTAEYVLGHSVLVPPPLVYLAAEKELLKGNNLYYLVSNYDRGAVHRAAEGNLKTAKSWLDKSQKSVAEASPDDLNLKAATRDIRLRKPSIATQRRAINSIFRNP